MRLDQVLLRNAKRLRDDVKAKDSGDLLRTHIPTGFRVLDDTFGGIRRGVCTELLGHTGEGKSTFARQVAEAAARAGAGVLWVCGEDPEDATAERYLSDGSGISAADMGRLALSESELTRCEEVAAGAQSWAQRIEVVFGAPTVDECLALVQEVTQVGKAPLLLGVWDYAQIFGDESSLESEVARLSRGLNQLSGDRRMANLLLSQVASRVLERGREEYQRYRSVNGFCPKRGDTEYCRRMEKSCKAGWSIFRPDAWRREMGEDAQDTTAELHVWKSSFGPTGWRKIGWDGPACRFTNL